MNFKAQEVFDLFAELYPIELKHVLAELRARVAETRLAELENPVDGEGETPTGGGFAG